MKKLTIKHPTTGAKTTIKVFEGVNDTPIERWNEMKKWIIQVQTGADIPSLRDMFKSFTAQFDKASPGGMYTVVHDYIYKLSQVEANDDPDQMVFALMVLEEGEDPNNTDESFMKEKLERLAQAGLTQGVVKEEVSNFIIGSIGQ